jgi:F0F1-type ATP synthase assembly protein I
MLVSLVATMFSPVFRRLKLPIKFGFFIGFAVSAVYTVYLQECVARAGAGGGGVKVCSAMAWLAVALALLNQSMFIVGFIVGSKPPS